MNFFTITSAAIFTLLFGLTTYAGNTKDKPLLSNVITSISLDMDKDGKIDIAHLAESDKSADGSLDLWVLLSSDTQYFRIRSIAHNMSGGVAGMGTELKLNATGSLQIYSYNEAIGRNPWASTMTFAYRGKALVLAGYTISRENTHDRSSSICDVNMLTRRGTYTSNKGSSTFVISESDIKSINLLTLDYIEMYFAPKYCV